MPGKFARLIVCAVCLAIPATVSAQSNTALGRARAKAESLTLQLMAEQASRATGRVDSTASLVALAAERERALTLLLDTDPASVWRLAIPGAARNGLPLEARSHVESELTVDGELEIYTEDYASGARVRSYLKTTAGERLALYGAGDGASRLSGDRVRVHGVRLGDALALQPGSTSVQSLNTVVANTFGAQKTLLILVNFQDNQAQPYGVGDAYNVAFGTTSDYDLEASSGQTWLTGDVAGWFTIPVSSGGCDTSAIASYAKSAASASGVRLSNYSRFVYAFPSNACAWWGLGSVGGSPSQAWINGSLQLKVLAHEMGHNFGLYHAHSLDCGADPIGTACTQSEYGDPIDMMGQEGSGHFSAFAKERLGWLNYGNSPPLTTVTGSGSYFIEAYAAPTSGQKALKVLQQGTTSGSRTWYYVEYRKGTGFDTPFGSNANLSTGVVIHTGSESTGNSSYLLDMTPQTDSWYDTALDVGNSFSDPAAGITITPTSVDASGAWVNVTVGAPACVRAAPIVTISPSATVWTSEGSQLTFKVTATNQDTLGCTASHFTVSAAIAGGWPVVTSTPDLTLDPGASAGTDVLVDVPLGTPSGMYSLVATVTPAEAPALTSNASVSLGLSFNAALKLTSSAAAYSRNQPVALTSTVTMNGQPVQGTTVTFTLTRPDGLGQSVSATTDSTGQAKATFKLKGNSPIGTYRADARASVAGVPVSGSMTITIQ